MERHPRTAIQLTCPTCGLVRVADDYGSAHARGQAHIRLSGHPNVAYKEIDAAERIKSALSEAKMSMEEMALKAGVRDIAIEAGIEQDVAARR